MCPGTSENNTLKRITPGGNKKSRQETPSRALGVPHGPPYGGFLKWWYPTSMGVPTKNAPFGGVLGVSPFNETPMIVFVKSYKLEVNPLLEVKKRRLGIKTLTIVRRGGPYCER